MRVLLLNSNKNNAVALVPSDVATLVKNKVEVFFTKNVGIKAGYTDAQYIEQGAQLAKVDKETFKTYDVIVSNKAIETPAIYKMANPNQLF